TTTRQAKASLPAGWLPRDKVSLTYHQRCVHSVAIWGGSRSSEGTAALVSPWLHDIYIYIPLDRLFPIGNSHLDDLSSSPPLPRKDSRFGKAPRKELIQRLPETSPFAVQ